MTRIDPIDRGRTRAGCNRDGVPGFAHRGGLLRSHGLGRRRTPAAAHPRRAQPWRLARSAHCRVHRHPARPSSGGVNAPSGSTGHALRARRRASPAECGAGSEAARDSGESSRAPGAKRCAWCAANGCTYRKRSDRLAVRAHAGDDSRRVCEIHDRRSDGGAVHRGCAVHRNGAVHRGLCPGLAFAL